MPPARDEVLGVEWVPCPAGRPALSPCSRRRVAPGVGAGEMPRCTTA
jgi:hypothetical protein